jgi:hypothetical protein
MEMTTNQQIIEIYQNIKNYTRRFWKLKNDVFLWSEIESVVGIKFPSFTGKDCEKLFLYIHQDTKLICLCGKQKHFHSKKFRCLRSCPYTRVETKNTCIERYGKEHISQVSKFKKQKIKTCIEHFGVRNPSQSAEIQNKKQETSIKNWGTVHPSQSTEVQNRIKDTLLKRYNVEHALQHKPFLNKSMATSLSLYNVLHYSQLNISKEQQKASCQINYNRDFYSQKHISLESLDILNNREKFAKLLSINSRSSLARKLGVSDSQISRTHKKFGLKILSRISSSFENEISIWLTKNNIEFKPNNRTAIKPFELDFYFPKYEFAIEFNGDYWHMNPKYYIAEDYNKNLKLFASDIWKKDQQKLQLCKDKNINLITIWESDWNENKDFIKGSVLEYIIKYE